MRNLANAVDAAADGELAIGRATSADYRGDLANPEPVSKALPFVENRNALSALKIWEH